MEELEPYDYGPICPDECDDDSSSSSSFIPVRLSYVIIARASDPVCSCRDRKFTVNLHRDGSWSFTFTNGEFLSIEEQDFYCKEISAAQSLLEGRERWRRLGKNIGLWDPETNFGATGTGARADDGTVYFPGGRSDDSFNSNKCSTQPPSNMQ